MSAETVVIERRFRGPPESGHGGYSCGLLARHIEGAAEVTLRSPPPLERPLTVERDEGRFVLRDNDATVAEAQPSPLELATPEPVGIEEAERAVARYAGFERHAFPGCFACGPEREQRDGLRLFPGRVSERDVFACPWQPDESLADESGEVRPEFVWAALDCPTAFACDLSVPLVLARLTARIDVSPTASSTYVVMAWPLGREGRKQWAGCVILDPDGRTHALSKALWIAVKDPESFGVAVPPKAG